MSAENQMALVRMSNGEFWVLNRATSNTCVESYGRCHPVAKVKTYAEALSAIAHFGDERSPDYIYTEHEDDVPSEAELMSREPGFLHSYVFVEFRSPGRDCGCVDARDITEPSWFVVERQSDVPWSNGRTLRGDMTYAEALTFASAYVVMQPGESVLEAPKFFRHFAHYPEHDCSDDHYNLVHHRERQLSADAE
jgi:hypothetical protein